MTVRNHLYHASQQQGKPTEAINALCPCRPCYRPHKYNRSFSSGGNVVVWKCVNRENHGCPNPLPKPEHIPTLRGTTCKRCLSEIPKPPKQIELKLTK